MILVDTNVVSAMIRPSENAVVTRWLDDQDVGKLFLTSITIYEILYGLAICPPERKLRDLKQSFESKLSAVFDHRVLSYDFASAKHAAALAARRRMSGINVDLADTQIAGIALARKATLATRNIRHFADAGIELIDPWAAG